MYVKNKHENVIFIFTFIFKKADIFISNNTTFCIKKHLKKTDNLQLRVAVVYNLQLRPKNFIKWQLGYTKYLFENMKLIQPNRKAV